MPIEGKFEAQREAAEKSRSTLSPSGVSSGRKIGPAGRQRYGAAKVAARSKAKPRS